VQDSYNNNNKSDQDFYIKIPKKVFSFLQEKALSAKGFIVYCALLNHASNFWAHRKTLLIGGVNKDNFKAISEELLRLDLIFFKSEYNGHRGHFYQANRNPNCLKDVHRQSKKSTPEIEILDSSSLDSRLQESRFSTLIKNKTNIKIIPPLNPPHTVGWTSKKYFDFNSKNGRFGKYLEAWSEIAADDLDLIYLIETAAKRYQNETGAQFPIRITKPAVLDKFTAQVREKWKDFILRYPNPYRDSSN